LGYSIIKILEEENREPTEKADVLISKLTSAELFFESVKRLCINAADSRIERAVTCAENMQHDFDYFAKIVKSWVSDEGQDAARRRYARLIEEFAKLKVYSQQFARSARGIRHRRRQILRDISYSRLLSKRYGLSLAWILTWYEDELASAKKRVKQLAASLEPGKRPIVVLREYIHTPYDKPEDMFAAMEGFLKIAKEQARNFLDFPEEESCRVVGLKEMEKDVYPMGHSGGPDPIKGGLTHTVALNQYNFTAFTKGWLMMMAIHETYYGHNIQWMKIAIADLPKTFKIEGGKEVPLVEGLAHRGEELLQQIYRDEAFRNDVGTKLFW
jgi:hypothetical protein